MYLSMVDLIKQMAIDTSNAQTPVNIFIGTVASVDPITVDVTPKLKLTKEFLILTERVTRYEVDLTHSHVGFHGPTNEMLKDKMVGEHPIRTGLKVGDSVVLLRVQGGQQFVIIDKVVD